MKQSRFPKGWDEKRVSELVAHYEAQPEDEMVAEDEAMLLDPEQTVMEVPSKLVPAVRELIAKHEEQALARRSGSTWFGTSAFMGAKSDRESSGWLWWTGFLFP